MSLIGCSGSQRGKQFTAYSYFDTQTTVVIFDRLVTAADNERAETVWGEIKNAFEKIESAVGWEESSLAKFNAANAGETLEIDEIFYTLLLKAKDYYALTDGAFNPAVGYLSDLWGFSPDSDKDKPYFREMNTLPKEEYIDAFKELCVFDEVEVFESESKFYVKKPEKTVEVEGITYGVKLDMGGLGKGYAADVAAEILKQSGYSYGYVAVGNSSISLLKNNSSDYGKGEDWYVEIVHPRVATETYARLIVNSATVSTSGDYERYFTIDGVRYSHILNPKTGYPIKDGLISASVIAATACEGDAISTALCVMGEEKAKLFAQSNPSYGIVFLTESEGVLRCYNGANAQILTDGIN